jgi:hypothetical protein
LTGATPSAIRGGGIPGPAICGSACAAEQAVANRIGANHMRREAMCLGTPDAGGRSKRVYSAPHGACEETGEGRQAGEGKAEIG